MPMLLFLLRTGLAADTVYIQTRIVVNGATNTCGDPPYKELAGSWGTSGSRSTQDVLDGGGCRYGYTSSCSFRLTPTNLVPGVTYQLETTHIGINASPDLTVSVACDVATMSVSSTDAFRASYANSWKAIGRFTMPPIDVDPSITFTFSSGTIASSGGRWYVDGFKFVDVSDPCVDALPQLDTVTGPLTDGQTFVDVPGVTNSAVAVHVYADNVEIGALTEGVVGGVNRVTLTNALVKDQIITATQNDASQVQSCRPEVGQVVGGGANPRIRVCINIRQNTALTGPIGADGGTTPNTLKFLGATNVVGGSLGNAPMGGRLVLPSSCWQTLTFLRSDDFSFCWANSDGTNAIKGDYGVLESIDFAIDDLTNTGPFRIYIDNIKNGSNVIQDFESATNGQRNVVFYNPYFSGSTSPFLLSAPDICEVTSENADNSSKSEVISFQFKKLTLAAWVRLITQGTVTPNPIVDLNQPISFSILVLPVGQTNAGFPFTATGPTNQTVAAGNNIALSTAVTGESPLTYRWFKDGVELSGETTASLTIPGITYEQSGSYSVEITGPCNTITNLATITVIPAPAINVYVYDTANTNFSVIFDTRAGLSYVLEYKDNLTNSTWTILQTVPGDGNPGFFTDPLTNRPSARFYRLRAQ